MSVHGMRIILALRRTSSVLRQIPKYNNLWLSPEEQLRYAAFTSSTRRQHFLGGRFLARQAIGHMHGGEWSDYFLTSPEGGAPRLIAREERAGLEKLSISISHTDGWVACAVSFQPVGVDIQSREKRRDILGLSQLIECNLAKEADQSVINLNRVFYAQWGLREAWFKQSDCAINEAGTPRFAIGKNAHEKFNGLVSDIENSTLVVFPARADAIEMTRDSFHVQNWAHWHQIADQIGRPT